MGEYIDREKVLLAKFTVTKESEYAKGWNDALDAVVENAMAADVAPVVHSRWEHSGGDEWFCISCGNVVHTEGSWEKPSHKYCLECGARMDGKEPDNEVSEP